MLFFTLRLCLCRVRFLQGQRRITFRPNDTPNTLKHGQLSQALANCCPGSVANTCTSLLIRFVNHRLGLHAREPEEPLIARANGHISSNRAVFHWREQPASHADRGVKVLAIKAGLCVRNLLFQSAFNKIRQASGMTSRWKDTRDLMKETKQRKGWNRKTKRLLS